MNKKRKNQFKRPQRGVSYSSGILSPREAEVLTLSAQGKKGGQISHVLNMSEDAVKDTLERIRRKLNTLNTTHSVAVALSRGLIKP